MNQHNNFNTWLSIVNVLFFPAHSHQQVKRFWIIFHNSCCFFTLWNDNFLLKFVLTKRSGENEWRVHDNAMSRCKHNERRMNGKKRKGENDLEFDEPFRHYKFQTLLFVMKTFLERLWNFRVYLEGNRWDYTFLLWCQKAAPDTQ